MNVTKISLLIALVGHLFCWHCDRLMTYVPGGRFSAEALKDNAVMSKMYRGMPLKRMEISMMPGTAAMTMEMFGYLAVADWMRQFSAG